MNLYLVRHGKARSEDKDPIRPLSKQGRKDVEAIASVLAQLDDFTIGQVLHSGKARAQQTAEIIAQRADTSDIVVQGEDLDPLADVTVWARNATQSAEDIMLVGHLPHLSNLASYLLCGNAERELVQFTAGTVACLSRDVGTSDWALRWILPPKLASAAESEH